MIGAGIWRDTYKKMLIHINMEDENYKFLCIYFAPISDTIPIISLTRSSLTLYYNKNKLTS